MSAHFSLLKGPDISEALLQFVLTAMVLTCNDTLGRPLGCYVGRAFQQWQISHNTESIGLVSEGGKKDLKEDVLEKNLLLAPAFQLWIQKMSWLAAL